MKLKKLLSGLTAAVMALSAAAVGTFTSSAADPYVKIIWTGYNGVNVKTIAQGTADDTMAGATQVKVSFNMGPNAAFNQMVTIGFGGMVGSNTVETSVKGEGWPSNGGASTAIIDLATPVASGDIYKITATSDNWEACTTEDNYIFGITSVEFLDGSGGVLKTQTEVGADVGIDVSGSSSDSSGGTTDGQPEVGRASLMFADSTWQWGNWYYAGYLNENGETGFGNDVTVDKDGTYTVSISADTIAGEVTKNADGTYSAQNTNVAGVFNASNGKIEVGAFGTVVFCVDIYGWMKTGTNPGKYDPDQIKAAVKSIKQDGEDVAFDPAKILYGNIEDDNNKYRIEIYNDYGDSASDPAIEPLDIDFAEKLEVTFSIAGLDSANKPSASVTTKKTTTTKSTAVKKVKAVSKKKKTLKVTWKKQSGVKGYIIQAASKKNFKKKTIVAKKTLKKNTAKVNLKTKKIKSGKKYFVRVRAYKTYTVNGVTKQANGPWSKKIKSAKVK